ncbi:hypothetical protein [Flavobacterium collinsii]|uniref:Uncharacterized protein n=1 Tax=Flavobacterium collinsii TaxID=1114861 RepID=A0ABN7EGA7_9FLAO|nr:hypothetical protein [Flavobacterium collinsii]CAA9195992.1 hypothetical protein FLACOL7796_00942 [Flavobacterium collinsii]
MKKLLLLLVILPFMISCKGQKKMDLLKLNLNEPIKDVLNFDDNVLIGVETIEYPFCLLIEVEKSENYSFEGIDLEGQKIFFQINSEKLKTDSISRFGGGHIDLKPIKNEDELKKTLLNFNAESKIYGLRIEMKTPGLKTEILKKIELKYGKGIKNINAANGLYWNLKKENKYIFFAPDYDRLIILNNTNLSTTCYWDTFNGLIDFGGCDSEKYTKELTKNSTKPEDTKNKPIIKIDKNWNVNNLITGKSTEEDFAKSQMNKSFERMEEIDGSTGNVNEIMYRDEYHDFYFYLSASKVNPENRKENLIVGYAINDFRKVEISFENGLNVGMKFDDVVKLFDKKSIIDYEDLKFANYIEIKNGPYKTTLIFDKNKLFSGIFVK